MSRGPYFRGPKVERTPDKPRIQGFLVPTDVGALARPVRPELAKRWRIADKMTPGSFEAIRVGCRCDRLVNSYGRGVSNGFMADHCRFEVHPDCPLHNGPDPDGAA